MTLLILELVVHKCYYAFFLVRCGCYISYIVSVHIQYEASIFTLLLCRGHSWRVRLAKHETLTPLGHLDSPLVCRGSWMSTVVLYCWCHSDRASVLLYFTLNILWLWYNIVITKMSSEFYEICALVCCWFSVPIWRTIYWVALNKQKAPKSKLLNGGL